MAVRTTRTVEELEAYCARLRAAGLDAPWSRPGPRPRSIEPGGSQPRAVRFQLLDRPRRLDRHGTLSCSGSSPRAAGPRPRDALRLALRILPQRRGEGGRSL